MSSSNVFLTGDRSVVNALLGFLGGGYIMGKYQLTNRNEYCADCVWNILKSSSNFRHNV